MPSPRDRSEEILERLVTHELKLTDLEKTLLQQDTRISIVERILLLGDGNRKPLVELMRNMENRLEGFIDSQMEKDKRDEINRAQKVAKEEEHQRWFKRTVITTIIGFTITIVLPALWQILQFWTRVYPILDRLNNSP